MQSVTALRAEPVVPAFHLPVSGTQFLPVSGYITDRCLVTYRAAAARLSTLVPAPFSLDTYEGYGFVSVCAVEILGMGLLGTPRFLRFDNREFLYRLAVRLGGEPTFITLRSDVSSPVLAVLGRYFSHYRPRLAKLRVERPGGRLRMECKSRDRAGDALLDVDPDPDTCEHTSIFPDSEQASAFLVGMGFSADCVRGRVRVQPIDHSPWHPHFVPARAARFEFISSLERSVGTPFTYDGTLATRGVQQTWKAARWL